MAEMLSALAKGHARVYKETLETAKQTALTQQSIWKDKYERDSGCRILISTIVYNWRVTLKSIQMVTSEWSLMRTL